MDLCSVRDNEGWWGRGRVWIWPLFPFADPHQAVYCRTPPTPTPSSLLLCTLLNNYSPVSIHSFHILHKMMSKNVNFGLGHKVKQMRVETVWILFVQEKKLIQCPRKKKSRRLKKVWQCFGFNFRRPLPLWYFYWGSLYKPLVNYWGQPTFILKMRPNIKTFPNWKDHQTV